MPRIKVVVLPPGGRPLLVIDEETERLLAYTITYNRKIETGEYREPEKIVEIFKELATRGHETKGDYNPRLIYKFLEAILTSDAPPKERLTQAIKYMRSAIKS